MGKNKLKGIELGSMICICYTNSTKTEGGFENG